MAEWSNVQRAFLAGAPCGYRGRREAEQKTVSLRERAGDVAVLSLKDAITLLWQRAHPARNGRT
jgi:hypothetical protein